MHNHRVPVRNRPFRAGEIMLVLRQVRSTYGVLIGPTWAQVTPYGMERISHDRCPAREPTKAALGIKYRDGTWLHKSGALDPLLIYGVLRTSCSYIATWIAGVRSSTTRTEYCCCYCAPYPCPTPLHMRPHWVLRHNLKANGFHITPLIPLMAHPSVSEIGFCTEHCPWSKGRRTRHLQVTTSHYSVLRTEQTELLVMV
ncbi:hypothetical protein V8C37DRAFT_160669 [Trichoderma ceciliae]